MKLPRLLAIILLFAWLPPAIAQDIQPFVRGSYASILKAHHDKNFIFSLWSLDCVYCRDDFALFEKLTKSYPSLNIVLVATDTSAQTAAIAATLRHYNLQNVQSWVFADSFVERLRFEVDRQWYGELPRTYLFAADGKIDAVSGKLDEARLMRWAQEKITLR